MFYYCSTEVFKVTVIKEKNIFHLKSNTIKSLNIKLQPCYVSLRIQVFFCIMIQLTLLIKYITITHIDVSSFLSQIFWLWHFSNCESSHRFKHSTNISLWAWESGAQWQCRLYVTAPTAVLFTTYHQKLNETLPNKWAQGGKQNA